MSLISNVFFSSNVGLAMNVASEKRGSPRSVGEQGEKGIYFRGAREKINAKFLGEHENKDYLILGNREHKKKTIFGGNKGTSQFISRE